MYNEEFKREFMKTVENPLLYEQQFATFEPFEEMYDKDLYDFTVDQILSVYKSRGTLSFYFLYHINNRNARYATYALNRNLVKDGQNHYLEIKMPVLMSCLDKFGVHASVITREELKMYTGKLLNPLDKYLMWACYDGLDGDEHSEITRLKYEDIDEEKKIAKLISGRVVNVSDDLILAARESKDTYLYDKYLSPDAKGSTNPQNILVGDNIWKVSLRKNTVDSDKARGIQAYRLLNKCIQYLDLPNGYISIHNLRQSGLIDYVQKLARENNIQCRDVLYGNEHLFELVSNQYQIKPNQRSVFYRKYKDFLDDNGAE